MARVRSLTNQAFRCVLIACAVALPAAGQEPALAKQDAEFLDSLFKKGLPDPTGATYIRFKMRYWDVWTQSALAEAEGWLTGPREGKPAEVLLPRGGTVSVPEKYDRLDFFEHAQKATSGDTTTVLAGPRIVLEFAQQKQVNQEDFSLAYAAWAHRLGNDRLAGLLLRRARGGGDDDDALARFSVDYWTAYSCAVHAYMVRADREAMAHLLSYLNFGMPAEKEDDAPNQIKGLMAELQRRQKLGRFAKEPASMPAELEKSPVDKRVAHLIDALDEVDARQWGQPGGISFDRDPRVLALVRIGDPAVPALIDCVEKDTRLTRSVHFWRDFAPSRTILSVREVALSAVMSILRVRVFEPASTGDNFTARGEGEAKGVAQTLRKYWAAYGKFPFPERMMKVLTDPKASGEALREAAHNLATLGDVEIYGTTVWSSRGIQRSNAANPAIGAFSDPTAAEAMLSAMDRDLAAFDRRAQAQDPDKEVIVGNLATGRTNREMLDYERGQVEDAYVQSLILLADRRIVGEIRTRYANAKSRRMQRKWAYACCCLGDPGPINEIANRFQKESLRDNDLVETVSVLLAAGTKPCDEALWYLGDKNSPHYERISGMIAKEQPSYTESQALWRHPFCLRFLRAHLDDDSASGVVYRIDGNRVATAVESATSWFDMPLQLADAGVRNREATGTMADAAALKLNEVVVGLPYCHPLLKDRKERLAALRAALDNYLPEMKLLGEGEAWVMDVSLPAFRPAFGPLGRTAAEGDVAGGSAIFCLGSGAKLSDLRLPASALLKRDKDLKDRPRVLIVQAEIDGDGKAWCGIIERHDIRRVSADELEDVKALPIVSSIPLQ